MLGRGCFRDIVHGMKDDSAIGARVTVHLILLQLMPYFLTGFASFALLRYIFHKMGLDNPDAIGKEFDSQDP